MEAYIKRRLSDPRFKSCDRSVKPWYQSGSVAAAAASSGDRVDTGFKRSRFNFAEEKKEKKKKSKGSGSDTDSSSSESDGEGGRRKKEKKGKKKKGRCWSGYEPTPGVEPYAPGSCRKK